MGGQDLVEDGRHLVAEMAAGSGHQLVAAPYSHSIVAGGLLVTS